MCTQPKKKLCPNWFQLRFWPNNKIANGDEGNPRDFLTEAYSRGVDGRAVHQRSVVVVFNKVSLLGLLLTRLWLVSDSDLGAVRRVVEVDDVNIKDQHS